MYQKSVQGPYNRHYGKAKPGALDSPSKMLLRKRMLEDDSEDEFLSNKQDGEWKIKEQKTPSPRQWLSELKFPELGLDWRPEDGGKLLYPVLWGVGVAVMSWIVIYFDSKAPGMDPQLPPTKQLLNPSKWPLAYWTSLICGFFVFTTVALLQY